ncbi:MAG TPA: SDR family oxidoreductase [Flavitalea sp.]|nr:SDR family oxidoreductase [Flavitalea sp.]
MSFNINLEGKTVVITGVSSGIGAGIAKLYAQANANISGCALEDPDDESVKNFIQTIEEESGKTPLYVQADVTIKSNLENFISKTIERYGGIDILASNAGSNIYKGIEFCNREDWLYNMNLNMEAHWNIACLCKPYLEKDGCGIILINTSCHAYNTLPGSFPYNIAKTGLRALVQSLTLEWSPAIRTVGIAPGFTDTSLVKEWFDTFPDPAAKRKSTLDAFPLKRLGTVEEIGGWFVFLSSKYAAFAAGQTYLIDGGNSALMMNPL